MNHPAAPSLVLCELADPGLPGLLSYSPFCLKVHHALRYAGLSYTRRHGRTPGDFKAHNPRGQVPVLLVDGRPIADSTPILRFIEEETGALERGLDARSRAESWLWEDHADTALNGYVVAARWADERNWPKVLDAYFGAAPWPVRGLVIPRVRARVIGGLHARDVWRAGPEACWARFERTLDLLEARAPAQGFWVSAAPSAADFAIFGQLHSLRTALTAYQAEALGKRASLSAYLDRVGAVAPVERAAGPVSRPRAAAQGSIALS
ncbi:MAG: glutathione S-transferase N-terminal domain-containing protein [Byssovorax sp.]